MIAQLIPFRQLLLSCGLLWCGALSADVGAKLGDWWEARLEANINTPSVYSTSERHYFSGGGFSYRNERPRPFGNFVEMQTPNLSASCGAIDFQMGGFSMIKAEEFVESLEETLENVPSLAFMLAIQVVSPQLNTVMQEVRNFADNFLNLNMDTCQAAQGLIGGVHALASEEQRSCITKAVSDGTVADYADASFQCSQNTINNWAQAKNKASFTQGNLTWMAMMQGPSVATEETGEDDVARNNRTTSPRVELFADLEYAELIMNLVGTLVLRKENPNDPKSAILPEIVMPKINATGGTPTGNTILAALEYGSQQIGEEQRTPFTVRLTTCKNTGTNRKADPKECLLLNHERLVHYNFEGMRTKVDNLLKGIIEKLHTDQDFSPVERGLIAATRLPLYRYLAAHAAVFQRNATQPELFTAELSQYLARDIIYSGLTTAVEELLQNLKNLPEGISKAEGVKGFIWEVEEGPMKGLTVLEKENAMDAQSYLQFHETIRQYERMVISRLSSATLNSAMWGG